MKKITMSILSLVLAMVMVSSAFALDIPHIDGNLELRGGVTFGMKQDDIVAFEKGKGNTSYETSTDDDNSKIYDHRIDYKTEIAGVGNSNSHLRYFFDKQNNFQGMSYHFGEGDHPVNGNSIYNDMYQTIVQKYGEPMTKDALISSSLYSQELFDSLYSKELFKMLGYDGSVTDVAQWLVAYDDCYLLIDMHISKLKSTSNPFLKIGYRVFSESELQEIIGNDINTQQETNQKRNDDL